MRIFNQLNPTVRQCMWLLPLLALVGLWGIWGWNTATSVEYVDDAYRVQAVTPPLAGTAESLDYPEAATDDTEASVRWDARWPGVQSFRLHDRFRLRMPMISLFLLQMTLAALLGGLFAARRVRSRSEKSSFQLQLVLRTVLPVRAGPVCNA